MVNYNDSYCIIGAKSSGKSALANNLAKKLSSNGRSYLKISLDDFKHLPSLEELNNMKKNKDFSKYKEDKLNELISLRTKFPNVKNFEQLGYSAELENNLKQQIGPSAVDLYNKQFENMLFKELCDALNSQPDNTPVILDASSTLPVDFLNKIPNMKEQIKSTFPDTYQDYIKDETMLDNKVTEEAIRKFSNVWYAKMPADESKRNNDAKKPENIEINKKLTSGTEYESLATRTIDTEKFSDGSGIFKDENITKEVETNLKDMLSKKVTSDLPENLATKTVEASKKHRPSFLRRAVNFFKDYVLGFKLFRTIKKNLTKSRARANQKAEAKMEAEMESMYGPKSVEKVSENELDDAKRTQKQESEQTRSPEQEKTEKGKTPEKTPKEKTEEQEESQLGN